MNFITSNQENFQTNLSICNINTRNEHHLHRTNINLSFYYPGQQMHNIYINNIVYIVSSLMCFNASASSSGSQNSVLTKIIEITTQ